MKIPASIRELYKAQRAVNEKLQECVGALLRPRLEKFWHYDDRIKTEESFALKIESGRFADPANLEDFFGCMIVVRNYREIREAEVIVKELFEFGSRRPPSPAKANKYANSFQFDDLRLYVRYKRDPAVKEKGVEGTLFEIQIKTFLQHAWSIATHDLTYKSDSVSWPKQRIAYQVKAMLEHAEVSIAEAETLSKCTNLPQRHERSDSTNEIIKMLREHWKPDDLPENLSGLAENIDRLLANTETSLQTLKKILNVERKAGRGAETRNLSPYCAIVAGLVNQQPANISKFLTRPAKDPRPVDFKLLLPEELLLPPEIVGGAQPGRVIRIASGL